MFVVSPLGTRKMTRFVSNSLMTNRDKTMPGTKEQWVGQQPVEHQKTKKVRKRRQAQEARGRDGPAKLALSGQKKPFGGFVNFRTSSGVTDIIAHSNGV